QIQPAYPPGAGALASTRSPTLLWPPTGHALSWAVYDPFSGSYRNAPPFTVAGKKFPSDIASNTRPQETRRASSADLTTPVRAAFGPSQMGSSTCTTKPPRVAGEVSVAMNTVLAGLIETQLQNSAVPQAPYVCPSPTTRNQATALPLEPRYANVQEANRQ